MRKFRKNTRGVSNIMGYMFSFAVASMVMVSAVLITMNIVDDKTSQVARIEAQSVANYVANTVAEMVAMKEANPNAEYSKTMDIPLDLAGKSYYIEVTEDRIYVNTTDGHVTASCTTYHADELNIGVSGRISGSGGQATLSSFSSDYVYKLDFGTGNDASHSPVESGYYRVGVEDTGWDLDDSPYRAPIRLYNPSSEPLTEVPVKIILNASNFDYDKAIVTTSSGEWSEPDGGGADGGGSQVDIIQATDVRSNLHFYDPDPANEIAMDASIDENKWYPHWNWVTDEVVRVSIDPTYPTNMSPSYIDGNTLKLGSLEGYEADCKSYSIVGDDCVAVFDRAEAFQALGMPPETIDERAYTIDVKGELLDGASFSKPVTINVIYGDIYVDDVAGTGGSNNPSEDYTSIQDAIDAASTVTGKTIYVYEGEYGPYEGQINIDKDNINLTGQDRDLVIIDAFETTQGNAGTAVTVNQRDYVKITSFTIKNGGRWINEHLGGNGAGILLDSCNGVQIANCDVFGNNGDGIRLVDHADNNIISNCISHDNRGVYDNPSLRLKGDGIEIDNSDYNRVTNCEFYGNDNEQGNGVRLDDGSKYNIIENCEVYDNDGKNSDGISIVNSDELKLSTRHNIIANCTVYGHDGDNGDGIAIWANHQNYVRCPSNNSIDNCTIYNNYGEGNAGVVFWRARYCSISNSEIYSNEANIWMVEADFGKIENCNIYNAINLSSGWKTEGSGIHLSQKTDRIAITGCKIHDNDQYGILVKDTITAPAYTTNNHTIENCEIYENNVGLMFFKTENNVIRNCSINNSIKDGMRISGRSEFSIILDLGNFVEYNNIYDNGWNGVALYQSALFSGGATSNRIRFNNIYSNERYGVHVASELARRNHIYGNNFIENDQGNAYDNFVYKVAMLGNEADNVNKWDDSGIIGGPAETGNYWDDIDTYLTCGGNPPLTSEYMISSPGNNRYDYKPRGPATVCISWPGERATMFTIPNIIYADLRIAPCMSSFPYPWHKPQNIQEAIDHATPSGTVYVTLCGDGTYDEGSSIIVNKSVRIIGKPYGNNDKPRIKNTGGGPVFDVTKMNFDSDFDFCKFDKTIHFDSLNISEGSSGIYVSDNYNTGRTPSGNNVWIDISNCSIHDNINGISLHENYVGVTNCDIIGNEAAGINLSDSSYNNIVGCYITNSGPSGPQPFVEFDGTDPPWPRPPSATMDGIIITDNSDHNEI